MLFLRYHAVSLLMRNLDSSGHRQTGSVPYHGPSMGETVTGGSKRSNA